jgi:epoxyqueuosine reductase
VNESWKGDLVAYARSLGFERVGITSAEPLQKEESFLKNWLSQGRAGEMAYLERDPQRRARPAELLPGARSVIALAMSYADPSPYPLPSGRGPTAGNEVLAFSLQGEGGRRPDEGIVARYAWGGDYHKTINKRLQSLVRYLEAFAPEIQCRTFVDTGPLLERGLARRAGLGFIGKNTMLITKGLGSWVFLASIITTLDLPADAPDERNCGECRLCIDACPTEAITAPFELDARRCIAYLTIEKDGAIDTELREKMGGWVFGCDICQDVCPHNATARQTHVDMPTLNQILSIKDDAEFAVLFARSAIMRAGREGLLRNACVAAANLGRDDLIPRLQSIFENDSSPTVREHAAWALGKLTGQKI